MDKEEVDYRIRIFGERRPTMKAVQLYVKIHGFEEPFLALGSPELFHGRILREFLVYEGIPYELELIREEDFPKRRGKLYRAVGFGKACTMHLDRNVLVLSGESEAYRKKAHVRHARDLHRHLPEFRIISLHLPHE